MEEYVQAAIGKRLRKVVFQEHMEIGISYFERTWLTEKDFEYYFEEGTRLKHKYEHRIDIALGVEVGYNPHCSEEITKRLATRSWDQVGLSYHFCKVPDFDHHLNFLSKKKKNIKKFLDLDVSILLSHYLHTLIEAITSISADVLCHLDAGLRHVPGLVLNTEHRRLITSLLQLVKDEGMALELNTSGYETRDSPFPSFEIIQEAMALDLPMVAGSDAHAPHQVARHFDRLHHDLLSLEK